MGLSKLPDASLAGCAVVVRALIVYRCSQHGLHLQ
jgi:hypothetical protein